MSEQLDLGLFKKKRTPVILQSEVSECGLACLAMAMATYGREQSLQTLRSRYAVSSRGMSLAELQELGLQEGMEVLAYEAEPADLESLRLPAILYWNSNHYVLLVEVKAGRRAVIHDPGIGVRSLSWSDFCASYMGLAAEVTPAANFQKAKEKPRASLRTLLSSVPNYSSLVSKLFFLAFALELLVVVSPLYLQGVVDKVVPVKDSDLLWTLASGFWGIALIRLMASLARSWTAMALTGYMAAGLKGAVFSQAMSLPVSWYERRGVGMVLTRFASLNRIRDITGQDTIVAVIDLTLAALMMVVMLIYAPALAAVTLCVSLMMLGVAYSTQPAYSRAVNESITAEAQESNVLIESITGITALKFFSAEAFQRRTYLAAVLRSTNRMLDLHRLAMFVRTSQATVANLEDVVIVTLGAYMVMAGNLTLGTLFGFYAYKSLFATRVTRLIDVLFSLRELNRHSENIGDITDAEAEPRGDDRMTVSAAPSLAFENIDYVHPGANEYLLKNFSLKVNPGEIVGVTGPSGCGKSTLIKLLLGALNPNAGAIRIDGINVTKKSPASYRPLMSVVMQSDSLFTGTLLQNVTMFEEAPDLQRVATAVEDAQLLHETQAFPMGLNTMLMGSNATLSGGQRQRVLLARAFYKNAPILVLDEATSALDVNKEVAISEAIRRKKLTTLLVAHRVETLNRCDRVITLDDPGELLPPLEDAEFLEED